MDLPITLKKKKKKILRYVVSNICVIYNAVSSVRQLGTGAINPKPLAMSGSCNAHA